jgi:chorismate mutase
MMIRELLVRALRVPTVRALRGATTVSCDDAATIAAAVIELMDALCGENHLTDDEVISAIFTMTPDLRAAFPAETARRAGWSRVPLLCATEIQVTGSLPRCLRVLLHVERHWNGTKPRHVYLREAVSLRPDLTRVESVPAASRQ